MNVPLFILNVRYLVIIARNIFKRRRVIFVYNRREIRMTYPEIRRPTYKQCFETVKL